MVGTLSATNATLAVDAQDEEITPVIPAPFPRKLDDTIANVPVLLLTRFPLMIGLNNTLDIIVPPET